MNFMSQVVQQEDDGEPLHLGTQYPINKWNQYPATLNGSQRTNNSSEGWHDKFRLVVGKHQPDLYSALGEFQKEQSETETIINELSLGGSLRTNISIYK